ncbi:MAG: hypothetical protein DMG09_25550 [Acidobacteria bacterium]|nr:MAG: hypothetical protein DMG09_25550 [Acidobacteriota bacterium]
MAGSPRDEEERLRQPTWSGTATTNPPARNRYSGGGSTALLGHGSSLTASRSTLRAYPQPV